MVKRVENKRHKTIFPIPYMKQYALMVKEFTMTVLISKPLTGRRTNFCCDECSRWFANCTVWNRGRDPYSLRILYRDNFTCQHCGEFHAMKNENGIYIPIDDGIVNKYLWEEDGNAYD